MIVTAVTDEMVEAGASAIYSQDNVRLPDWPQVDESLKHIYRQPARLVLDAALPLAPQPVVDREALARILWLGRHLNSRPAQEAWLELSSDMKATYLAMADAVLALINGTAK